MPSPEDKSQRLSNAEYFGRLAETYGAGGYYGKRREVVLGAIRRLLPSLRSLLDLGCGNGTYLLRFSESHLAHYLAGADLSLEMLRAARIRAGGSPISLTACNAVALPFRDQSWHAIFCSHVLQFVNDHESCLREIARCLQPRGVLIIAGGELGVRARIRVLLDDPRWAEFMKNMPRPSEVQPQRTLAEYQHAAEAAGFMVESREAPFIVTGGDLAEFYRARWLPLIEQPSQPWTAMLDRVIAERGSEEMPMTESLLFCHKAG